MGNVWWNHEFYLYEQNTTFKCEEILSMKCSVEYTLLKRFDSI